MKRPSMEEDSEEYSDKRPKIAGEGEDPPPAAELGDDLVLEVLKRAEAKTLARAACVSRRWRHMAEDEQIWEAVCTRHWANIGCANQQLRAVVLALGGFRRLHSTCLLPLLRGPTAGRPAGPSFLQMPPSRWGKDEIQLALSLLSIGYFEKMNGLGCLKR